MGNYKNRYYKNLFIHIHYSFRRICTFCRSKSAWTRPRPWQTVVCGRGLTESSVLPRKRYFNLKNAEQFDREFCAAKKKVLLPTACTRGLTESSVLPRKRYFYLKYAEAVWQGALCCQIEGIKDTASGRWFASCQDKGMLTHSMCAVWQGVLCCQKRGTKHTASGRGLARTLCCPEKGTLTYSMQARFDRKLCAAKKKVFNL